MVSHCSFIDFYDGTLSTPPWIFNAISDVGSDMVNQHQSLSGEILPHFDINNLSVALKLIKLEIGPFHLEL